VARQKGLGERDLEEARALMAGVSVIPEALALAEAGVTSMHDVTRGGLLETLLEIARLSGVGMEIDGASVPVPPVVTRFAEAMAFDPMKMISSGTLAATVPPARVEEVRQAMTELGSKFSFVGRVTQGFGVRIFKEGTSVLHSEIRCEEDELARLWSLYPR